MRIVQETENKRQIPFPLLTTSHYDLIHFTESVPPQDTRAVDIFQKKETTPITTTVLTTTSGDVQPNTCYILE